MLTAFNMPTQGLGATGLNSSDGSMLRWNQCVPCPVWSAKARKDLRQFYPASCRIRAVRMRAHGALALWWSGRHQQIQWRIGPGQVLVRQMEVSRRGGQGAVA